MIFDRNMSLLQVGVSFLRVVGPQSAASAFRKNSGRNKGTFNEFFHIVSPQKETEEETKFSWILKFRNQPFAVMVKGLRRASLDADGIRRAHLEVL